MDQLRKDIKLTDLFHSFLSQKTETINRLLKKPLPRPNRATGSLHAPSTAANSKSSTPFALRPSDGGDLLATAGTALPTTTMTTTTKGGYRYVSSIKDGEYRSSFSIPVAVLHAAAALDR